MVPKAIDPKIRRRTQNRSEKNGMIIFKPLSLAQLFSQSISNGEIN
jgi:hypothetical protein